VRGRVRDGSGEQNRMTELCPHPRTQIISRDENGMFVECLDCKEIFESSELEESEAKENLKEDLSDA
jgi:hypothetical protein